MDLLLSVGIAVGVIILVALIVKLSLKPKESKSSSSKDQEASKKVESTKPTEKQSKGSKKQQNKPKKKGGKQPEHDHQRYVTTLRNHTNEVSHVEFSPCGNYLASSSEDRTLLLYPMKTLLDSSHPHKRVNVQGDVPGRFCFSINGTYILLSAQMMNQLYVYGVSSKGAKLLKEFKVSEHHKVPVNSVDFSSTLKYMMTCSSTDTVINLWDIKGNLIHSLRTNQLSNQMARFSPDGKFIGVATVSTELKLWEICEDKDGNFVSLEKSIKGGSSNGHKKTLTSLDFTSDGKKLVTGSEDGTWKLWNIDVDYKRDEDAKCELTQSEPNGKVIEFVRISPNNKRLLTISGTTITLWNLQTGDIIDTITNAHSRTITSISWSRNSDLFASSSEDGKVHIWKGD